MTLTADGSAQKPIVREKALAEAKRECERIQMGCSGWSALAPIHPWRLASVGLARARGASPAATDPGYASPRHFPQGAIRRIGHHFDASTY